MQNTHLGVIRLDGATASGRAYNGWRFTERVYEIRYLDTTPLTGSVPGS